MIDWSSWFYSYCGYGETLKARWERDAGLGLAHALHVQLVFMPFPGPAPAFISLLPWTFWPILCGLVQPRPAGERERTYQGWDEGQFNPRPSERCRLQAPLFPRPRTRPPQAKPLPHHQPLIFHQAPLMTRDARPFIVFCLSSLFNLRETAPSGLPLHLPRCCRLSHCRPMKSLRGAVWAVLTKLACDVRVTRRG